MKISMTNNNSKRDPAGFTLTELLVVVALIVAMLMILLPALQAFRQGRVEQAANSQLVADLNNARHLALLNGSPVYMVFFPKWSDLGIWIEKENLGAEHADKVKEHLNSSKAANNLLASQLTAYALYAEGSAGDQPTSHGSSNNIKNKVYMSGWKRLPSGAFFTTNQLQKLRALNDYVEEVTSPDGGWTSDDSGNRYLAPRPRGFDGEYGTNTPGATGFDLSLDLPLPYIGFGPRGQVVGVHSGLVTLGDDGWAISSGTGFFSLEIATGSVLPPLKDTFSFNLLSDGDDQEGRLGFSKYNRVRMNMLTGRSDSNICDVYWLRFDPTTKTRSSNIPDGTMDNVLDFLIATYGTGGSGTLKSLRKPHTTQDNPMLMQGVSMSKAQLLENLMYKELQKKQPQLTEDQFRWEIVFN
jgi:prepilin-type N-terminal cleavage/methylation domain-containing protein